MIAIIPILRRLSTKASTLVMLITINNAVVICQADGLHNAAPNLNNSPICGSLGDIMKAYLRDVAISSKNKDIRMGTPRH